MKKSFVVTVGLLLAMNISSFAADMDVRNIWANRLSSNLNGIIDGINIDELRKEYDTDGDGNWAAHIEGTDEHGSWTTDVESWSTHWESNSSGNFTPGWNSVGNNWFYTDPTGVMKHDEWLLDNGNWYYFGTNGQMLKSGTFTINGVNYSFGESGAMK